MSLAAGSIKFNWSLHWQACNACLGINTRTNTPHKPPRNRTCANCTATWWYTGSSWRSRALMAASLPGLPSACGRKAVRASGEGVASRQRWDAGWRYLSQETSPDLHHAFGSQARCREQCRAYPSHLELQDDGVDAVHGGNQLGGAELDLHHALRLQHRALRDKRHNNTEAREPQSRERQCGWHAPATTSKARPMTPKIGGSPAQCHRRTSPPGLR